MTELQPANVELDSCRPCGVPLLAGDKQQVPGRGGGNLSTEDEDEEEGEEDPRLAVCRSAMRLVRRNARCSACCMQIMATSGLARPGHM